MGNFKKNDSKRINKIMASDKIIYASTVDNSVNYCELKIAEKDKFTSGQKCDVCISYLSKDCDYKYKPFQSFDQFKNHILDNEKKFNRELIWLKMDEYPKDWKRDREIGILRNLDLNSEYLTIKFPNKLISLKNADILSYFKKHHCFCENMKDQTELKKCKVKSFVSRDNIFKHLKSLEISTGKYLVFDGKTDSQSNVNIGNTISTNINRGERTQQRVSTSTTSKKLHQNNGPTRIFRKSNADNPDINGISQAERNSQTTPSPTTPKRRFQNSWSTIGHPLADKDLSNINNSVNNTRSASSSLFKNYKIPKISHNLERNAPCSSISKQFDIENATTKPQEQEYFERSRYNDISASKKFGTEDSTTKPPNQSETKISNQFVQESSLNNVVKSIKKEIKSKKVKAPKYETEYDLYQYSTDDDGDDYEVGDLRYLKLGKKEEMKIDTIDLTID